MSARNSTTSTTTTNWNYSTYDRTLLYPSLRQAYVCFPPSLQVEGMTHCLVLCPLHDVRNIRTAGFSQNRRWPPRLEHSIPSHSLLMITRWMSSLLNAVPSTST